jgi:hypothetical protein
VGALVKLCVLVPEKLGFIFVSHAAVKENKKIHLAFKSTNQEKGFIAHFIRKDINYTCCF